MPPLPQHAALAAWAADHLLDPVDVDCTTTVMLKILDGKCKMGPHDKDVIPVLYDAIRHRPGRLLDDAMHALIARARSGEREALVAEIYEHRVLAETAISRPVMKAYKARLRAAGVLGGAGAADGD
ncbi:hypothetical protein dqs_1611 [Azoarcus olearius]|uniref:hypothetical protein n=1 Tax=Azoarcus sp. (strain BH72) TaxID=418699 RepID=UPI00080619DD|nr:hypothetical protein [Azoarcus olearius]ANQ84655.1 hypothetical protein dqs_1611 [Azoarcus olearius]